MKHSNTKAETMSQTAFQLGRNHGLKSDHISKKQRKALLAAAELDVCEVCQSFEAGRRKGIQTRSDAEQPARDVEAARQAAARERMEKLTAAVARENHHGEELHAFAARKRSENLGIGTKPAAVADVEEEKTRRAVIAKVTREVPVVPPEPEPEFDPLVAAIDGCDGEIELLDPGEDQA